MARPEFTEDQKNAVKAKGTVLVSAAAGSGKTAVLTERVVSRLCDKEHPIDADRLLIVTFTNAAALEMRMRINDALGDKCAADPLDLNLKKQKLLLKKAKICTVDAFCIDLVRRYFGVLGISPDFSIVGKAAEKSISAACIDKVMKNRYSSPNDGFDALCDVYRVEQNDSNLKETVVKLYEKSLCMAQPEKWIRLAEKNFAAEDIKTCVFTGFVLRSVQSFCKNAKDKLMLLLNEAIGSPFESNCVDGVHAANDILDRAIESAENNEWNKTGEILGSFTLEIKKMSSRLDPEAYSVITALKKKVNDAVTSAKKAVCDDDAEVLRKLHAAVPAVTELADMVTEYGELYAAELEKRGVYTFAMIEQLALKLLCREENGRLVPSEISDEITKLYDEVLVDEYQDNNELQDALFTVISKDRKNLFMVGDIKQSIYGFRNASPDKFLYYKDTFPKYEEGAELSKVVLSKNFRSRKGICDMVNAFCSVCFGKDTCGMDYTDEDRLVAGADFPESDVPDVDVLITDCADGDADPKKADGEAVAGYIEKIMSNGLTVGQNGRTHPLKYKDICILMRAPSTDAKYYVDALAAKGIPYFFDSEGFFDSPEILTVTSVLGVINNPLNDIDLLAAMTSPAFGISHSKIAMLKAGKKYDSLYSLVTKAAENGDKELSAFITTVSKLRMASVTLPPDQLIAELLERTSLTEIMSAFPNGSLRRDNLIKLQMTASGYDSGKGGLRRFLNDIAQLTDDPEAVKRIPDGVDAVKIMSFHGSKGLQFPVCIVCGLQKEFNNKDIYSKTVNDDRYGFAVKLGDDDSIGRLAVASSQKQRQIAEEIRLLYVALTRAEDRLVLSMSFRDAGKNLTDAAAALGPASVDGSIPSAEISGSKGRAKWILMTLLMQKDGDKLAESFGINPLGIGGMARFTVSVSKPVENGTGTALSDTQSLENEIADESDIDAIRQRFEYVYPYETETKIPSKLAVTELIRGERSDRSFSARPGFLMNGGLTPAEKGTATHKFMQLADYNNAKNDTAAEIERLKEWEFLTEEEADAVNADAVSLFFKSDLFKRIEASPNVLREYKFMIEYPYEDTDTIIQGIADCIFEENGEFVILDFKTDRVKAADDLRAEYAKQLEIYKYAIEKITGKRVGECILYSIPLGSYAVI